MLQVVGPYVAGVARANVCLNFFGHLLERRSGGRKSFVPATIVGDLLEDQRGDRVLLTRAALS